MPTTPAGTASNSFPQEPSDIPEIEPFSDFSRRYLLDATTVPTIYQSSAPERRLRIVGDRWVNNQDVTKNLNYIVEGIIPAFLLRAEGFDSYLAEKMVLVTPNCEPCYIFESALTSLGLTYLPADVKPTYNPRGGNFFSIGLTTIFLQYANLEFWANALVLPGDSSQIGGPELILGRQVLEWVNENSPRFPSMWGPS